MQCLWHSFFLKGTLNINIKSGYEGKNPFKLIYVTPFFSKQSLWNGIINQLIKERIYSNAKFVTQTIYYIHRPYFKKKKTTRGEGVKNCRFWYDIGYGRPLILFGIRAKIRNSIKLFCKPLFRQAAVCRCVQCI